MWLSHHQGSCLKRLKAGEPENTFIHSRITNLVGVKTPVLVTCKAKAAYNNATAAGRTSDISQRTNGAHQQAQNRTNSAAAKDSGAVAYETVNRFFTCLNTRDLGAMFSLLAPNVTYANQTLQVQCQGKQAVVKFYVEVLSGLPQGAALVVDDVMVSHAPEPPSAAARDLKQSSRRVSVHWHLEIGGVSVPGSEGQGLYRLDTATGLITEMRDVPQGYVQVLLPALMMASPVVNAMSPVLMPAVSVLQQQHPGIFGSSSSGSATAPGNAVPPEPQALLMGAVEAAAGVAETVRGMLSGNAGAPGMSSLAPMANPLPWTTNWYPNSGSSSYPGRGADYSSGSSVSSSATAASNDQYNQAGKYTSGTMTDTLYTDSDAGSSYDDSDTENLNPRASTGSSMAYMSTSRAAAANSTAQNSSSSSGGSPQAACSTRDSTRAAAAAADGAAGVATSTKTKSPEAREVSVEAADPISESSGDYDDDGDGPNDNSLASQEEIIEPASFVDLGPDSNTPVDLTGVWEKDAAASQAQEYETMMDVLGLSGLQRVTARLIEGVELLHKGEQFSINYLTVVPFFKVTEATRFDRKVDLMRRDLRPGKQTAKAENMPNGVRVTFTWPEPMSGQLVEEYILTSLGTGSTGDVMTVRSSLRVGAKTANVAQVYKRSGKNRDELLRESRARNNSLESVLDKQRKQWGS